MIKLWARPDNFRMLLKIHIESDSDILDYKYDGENCKKFWRIIYLSRIRRKVLLGWIWWISCAPSA